MASIPRTLGFVTFLSLLLLTAGAVHAAPPSGGATLFSKEKLKVKGCGADKDFVNVDLDIFGANWVATVRGQEYTGFFVQLNNKGTKFQAIFDGASENALVDALADLASLLCDGGEVVVGPREFKKSLLKFNKRFDAAKLKLKLKALGAVNGRPGKGVYKLKGKGDYFTD